MPVTVCGGGHTAQPVPGYGQAVVMAAAAVGEALAERGISRSSAAAMAAVIAGVTYDLNSVCANDPPPDPGLTATDVLDAINPGNFVAFLAAQQRVRDWFLHMYWYLACQCVGTATPAPPAISLPIQVTTSSGLPIGQTPDRCSGFGPTADAAGSGSGSTHVLWGKSSFSPRVGAVPAGATSLNVTLQQAITAGAAADYTYDFIFADEANIVSYGHTVVVLHGTAGPTTFLLTIPPNTGFIQLDIETTAGGSSVSIVETVSLYCYGALPIPLTPCCPPDQSTEQLLNQILSALQGLYASLPFQISSYADSTVHSGLSGSGSFALSVGTIAVRVNITAFGAPVGEIAGDPTTLLDAGWITPEAGGDPYASQRITHQVQLFPINAPTDAIHYTLGDSVTATLTEVTRGP